jgi:tRNA-dihydrouridine synthase B
MVCAEMVSVNALHYGDETSRRMLAVFPDEHPVCMQIFGSDPDRLASAARLAEEAGADGVDLNAGCPVPQVVKTGAGVRLMEDESLFGRCLEAMSKAVKVPVTVKMRLGFRGRENAAARLAGVARESGAAAVFLHARYRRDAHDGPPDLEGLASVAASAGIPVFGNGGVASAADARRMMDAGCAGVLVGRAAVGNPMIFLELARADGGTAGPEDRFRLLREHAKLIVEYYGEDAGIRRFRKFTSSYVHSLRGAAEFRRRAVAATRLEDLLALVGEYEAGFGKIDDSPRKYAARIGDTPR